MNKNKMERYFRRKSRDGKILKMMKITWFLIVGLSLNVYSSAFAQKVNLKYKDATLREVFRDLKEQTGYLFMFNEEEVDRNARVTLTAGTPLALNDALEKILSGLPYSFEILNNMVVIKPQVQQDKKPVVVKGKVSDAQNNPLPGVSVIVKGTTSGTATDVNGHFQLMLPDSASTLVFSFIGMETQEVRYAGQDTLKVTLNEASEDLKEVVVTGYQDLDKKTAVGAYSSIKAEDLVMDGTSSLTQMLQGKIPGMMVINQSGLTGQRQKVRVRGTSTVLGNADPVWVVDGIIQEDPLPFEMEDFNATIQDEGGDLMRDFVGSAIDWLSPSDIDDITVLKDAAATAIYGTKAANGVIVITTKRGERGRPRVTYYGRVSTSLRLNYNRMEIMNSQERVDLAREAFIRGAKVEDESVGYTGLALAYLRGEITRDDFEREAKYLESVNTDWFKILYRNPVSQDHSLSVSGGNENLTTRASVGFQQTLNTAVGNSQKRYRGAINVNVRFGPNFNLYASLSGSYTKTNAFADRVSPFSYAISTSRTIPCFDEKGDLYYYDDGSGYTYNILNELANSGNENTSSSINVNMNMRYSITSSLRLGLTVGGARSETFSQIWFTEYSQYIAKVRGYDYGTAGVSDLKYLNSPLPFGGLLKVSESRNFNYTVRLQADWTERYGSMQEHMVSLMGGFELRSSHYDGYAQNTYGYQPDRGKGFAEVPLEFLSSGEANNLAKVQPTVTDRLSNTVSYYASASYNYLQRYNFSVNVRGDANNRFGQDERNKFTPVWSFGFRWNISEEGWMMNVKDIFTDLSLMATIGYQGNVAEGVSPDLIAKYNDTDLETGEQTMSISKRPTPDIRWEKTLSMDYNLAWSLFKNRVSGNFSYYYKKTTDLITTKDVPLEYGVLTTYINQGDMVNYGWDMYVAFVPVRTKNFTWSLSSTFSHNTNKLQTESKDTENPTWEQAVNGSYLKDGYPMGAFWAFRFKGIDPQNGTPLIDDSGIEQDGASKDPTTFLEYMGQMDPQTNIGVNMVFRYKRFSLPISIYYVNGGKAFLPNPWTSNTGAPREATNVSTELNDRWRQPGDEKWTNIPGIPVGKGAEMVSYTTESGTRQYYPYEAWGYSNARVIDRWYIRFNDFQFSYDLPERWIKGIFDSFRVSVYASNPLQIKSKDYKGRDPEVVMGGQPRERSFSIGLDVRF